MGANSRKLRELEEKVLEWPKWGETRFSTAGLPEVEQIVLERARRFVAKGFDYDSATEEELKLLDTASGLLWFHIGDLFINYVAGMLAQGDHRLESWVKERVVWFMQQLIKDVEQERTVNEIEAAQGDGDPVDRVDEFYRTAPTFFTDESWNDFQDKLFHYWYDNGGKEAIAKRLAEQKNQLEVEK